MRGNKLVVGVFDYLDDAINAIHGAKDDGFEVEAYAPTYIPDLEHAVDDRRSPVCRLTFIGAITGLTCGFGLACWTAMDWPLRVSAKDIVAIPAFIVVGYEWTILFGALCTLLAIFIFCKLPAIFRKPGYDPRFSDDKIGVVVNCNVSEVERVQAKVKNAGAIDVEVRDAL